MNTRRQTTTASGYRAVSRVGAYGKLPNFGDFIGLHANVEPATSFQMWLARAVQWAERSQLPAVVEGQPLAFAFRPPWLHGSALVGVVRASCDAVGRRFPFAIFATIANETVTTIPHVVPMIAEAFLKEASRVLDEAPRLSSLAEIDLRLQALAPIGDPGKAEEQYAEWARSARVQDVWRDLYRTTDGRGARFALHTIVEALAPFAAEESAQTLLAVRVPIGAAWSLAVAFWVDIVRRAGMRRREMPTFCWSPWWAAGPPSALVSLGEPHPSCPAEAARGEGDTDVLCDLTSAAPSMDLLRHYEPISSALEDSLHRGEARVVDLLDGLDRPQSGWVRDDSRPHIETLLG